MSIKVAMCLYGITGGTNGNDSRGYPLSPHIAFDHYNRHILNRNDVDIFVHSWSVDQKDTILALYNPVSYKFEPQKIFNPWPLLLSQYKHLKLLIPIFRINHLKFFNTVYNLAKRVNSRWYSSNQVLNLVREHEEKNGFQYDYIMVTRFDVAFFRDLVFSEYDPDYFYVPVRNHGPSFFKDYCWIPNKNNYDNAFNDIWCFSNSEMMRKYATLYDNITNCSVRPPFASKQHITSFARKIKEIYYYGDDYHVIRFFFFGKAG